MVDQQLKEYIEEQKQQGYTESEIRQTLLNSGYSQQQIDQALSQKENQKILPKIVTTLLIITIITGFGYATYYFYTGTTTDSSNPTSASTFSLKANLTPSATTVIPGDDIPFVMMVRAQNIQNDKTGTTTYQILENSGEIRLSSKKEDLLIRQDKFRVRDSMSLPNTLEPGTYQIKAIIQLQNQEINTQTTFNVTTPETTNLETGETTAEQINEERIEKIKQAAKNNPDEAREACKSFTNERNQNKCLLDTGLKYNDESFCQPITNNDKKDTCYFNIYLATKEQRLCQGITDQNLKQTCTRI